MLIRKVALASPAAFKEKGWQGPVVVIFIKSRPFNDVGLFWNKDDLAAKSGFRGSAFG